MMIFMEEPSGYRNPWPSVFQPILECLQGRKSRGQVMIDLQCVNQCARSYDSGFSTFMPLQKHLHLTTSHKKSIQMRNRKTLLASRYRMVMQKKAQKIDAPIKFKDHRRQSALRRVLSFSSSKGLLEKEQKEIRMPKIIWNIQESERVIGSGVDDNEKNEMGLQERKRKRIIDQINYPIDKPTESSQQTDQSFLQRDPNPILTTKNDDNMERTIVKDCQGSPTFNPFLTKTPKALDLNEIIFGKQTAENSLSPMNVNYEPYYQPIIEQPERVNHHDTSFSVNPSPFHNIFCPAGNELGSAQAEEYKKSAIAMFYSDESSDQLFGQPQKTSKKPRTVGRRAKPRERIVS